MSKDAKEKFSIIIRENAFFKGTLNTLDSIRISGNYTGKIYSNKNVYIDSTANIDGDIEADNIIVAGIVKGNVKANSKIHLMSTSKLEGDIETQDFRIDNGGIFLGQCKNTKIH